MTGVSTLGQVLDQIDRIKGQQLQFSILSTQLTSGKKTQAFGGLGTDVLTSKRARADFRSLDSYINNITNADRRIKLTLNAIEEFQAQANTFSGLLLGLSQESTHTSGEIVFFDDPTTPDVVENIPVGVNTSVSDTDFAALKDFAAGVFDFLVDLVNKQDSDRYLLGGAETLTRPLNVSGTLDAAIGNLISDWKGGTLTTDDFIADLQDRNTTNGNPNAITDSLIGYNSSLSSGNAGEIFVRVDDETDIGYTVLANDQAFRDILVAVSYFKNEALGPIADEVEIDSVTGLPVVLTAGSPGATTDEQKENFYKIYNELSSLVSKATDRIDQLRFQLEGARARIDTIKSNHKSAQNILLGTIADVEDADINEVAVKLNTLQVQLEASFRLIATVQNLSLVNFI